MPTIDRTQLIIRETAPRTTPPPVGRQFRDALAQSGRAVLQSAVGAAAYLPGGQMIAAAVRGAVLPALDPMMQAHSGTAEAPVAVSGSSALGSSLTSPSTATLGSVGGSATADATVVGAGGSSGSVGTGTSSSSSLGGDDMLARGQEMSMQMLRLQEAMGEEDRRYTALSNVLHARHEMAKNAIGNIR
jgi:hypothetical protein